MTEAITIFDLAGRSRKINIDDEGRIVTTIGKMEGIVSSDNSTTDLLLANGVFTGEWELIKDCAIIKVGITSDVDAATNGLDFQQSPDQEIIFDEPYDLNAGNKKLFTPNPVAKYFRIVYTNGSSDQTLFSLQTIYSSVYAKPTSHRIGDNVTGNDDTELVKSVITFGNSVDDEYINVDVQNPLPVDGDSVYGKDIWEAQSDIGDFSGSIKDLFENLHSVITNVTATNPKELLVHFNRTIISNVVGLGAFSGDFSNTLIQIGNSGEIFTTVIDESASDTKYTTRTFQLPVTTGFNAIKLQFHTADTVTLSNMVILKTRGVVARIQATKPDNTVTDINATNGSNLKVSVEELESGISSNNNSQLNTTLFASDGGEFDQDTSTGAFVTADYSHHKIHTGDHFFNKDWVDLVNGATYDILVSVADTTKWPHFLFILDAEAEFNVILYAGTTTSSDGTPLTIINRNGNVVTANGLLAFHTPTVTDIGTQLARYKGGSGKQVGGSVRANNEQILTQNVKFLARITNDTTGNNWVDWVLDWYEKTNR